MLYSNVIVISDDENESVPTSKSERRNENNNSIETFMYDDESQSQDNDILEIKDLPSAKRLDINNKIDSIYKENELMAKYIRDCSHLDFSDGMVAILNNYLIKAYENANLKYKKSPEFSKLLFQSISLLEEEPAMKYKNIKNICRVLQSHSIIKKRVQLTTLSSNCTAKKQKSDSSAEYALKKKIKQPVEKPPTVIVIDDQFDDPANNVDDDTNNSLLEPLNSEVVFNQSDDLNIENITSQGYQILDPTVIAPQEDVETEKKIKSIENRIGYYKRIVCKLEQEEVGLDDSYSPYIKSERLKLKIVSLYAKLCALTGSESVKRRELRLKVREGHPSGPTKLLETIINDNIGTNGLPHFPNYSDVVTCVVKANDQYNLGMTKHDVGYEATALFVQCGRAIQKLRQEREWRDLMDMADTEVDEDPADNDAELLAKLQRNREIAIKNENDLLERYVKIDSNRLVRERKVTANNTNTEPPRSDMEENINEINNSSSDQGISAEHTTLAENDIEQYIPNFDKDGPSTANSSIFEDYLQNSPKDYALKTQESKDETKSNCDEENVNETCTGMMHINMKEEPIDFIAMLEASGVRYTSCIGDVIDPFVIIDILSDSDDE